MRTKVQQQSIRNCFKYQFHLFSPAPVAASPSSATCCIPDFRIRHDSIRVGGPILGVTSVAHETLPEKYLENT
jgi:hypothetical protein